MRFLCLHGMGTNSRIYEMQTAAIRYGLDSQHTYEFIDGTVPTVAAHGIESIAGPNEEFLQYSDPESLESVAKALYDLEKLVDEEGPFDGVMAFSSGAALVASLMVHKLQKDPEKERLNPVFRCAIFLCGGPPEDPLGAISGQRRRMDFESDGEIIRIPTAHIWGANDQLYPTFGPVLSRLCCSDLRSDYIHDGGHEIPGPKDPKAVIKAVHVINRAIERALADQSQ
ncbi:serine hydrolase FSH [Xylaria curta]|nr:serine hydrolase FSH [Xylaria curta]